MNVVTDTSKLFEAERRDTPRRVTPDLLDFYKTRAKQLRDEAFRNMWRGLWALLTKGYRTAGLATPTPPSPSGGADVRRGAA